MTDKGVVFALFDNEAAADAAVESLKAWDKLDDDVKLNAIGVLALDEHGKLKMHKVGPRRGVAKGVASGAVVVVLAGYIVSPLALPVAFGAVGATRRSVPLSPERRDQLSAAIKKGKAAVGIQVKMDETAAVSAKLEELGGIVDILEMTPDLEAAAGEVPADDSTGA